MNTESCFRFVPWMFLLLGYLQANPINPPELCDVDISFHLLRTDVSCGENRTFVSPRNILKHCEANALETIMNELNKIKIQCKDDSDRINQTLEQLDVLKQKCPFSETVSSNLKTEPSVCNWTSGSFAHFIKYFERFIQQVRSTN